MEQQIRNWLQSQGYPLEMRAAAAYRDAGFRVVQSNYYQDPESSDWREIDVVADRTWIAAETNSVPIRIMFVAECKASREKPWILLRRSEP
jgi:Holliday junction resolvase-like predicted endonuclease